MYRLILLVLSLIILGGCAHSIEITPDISKIEKKEKNNKIGGTAGYYFDAKAIEREFVTPGGGGDRVRYFPYKDVEPGFVKVLNNVYQQVSKVNDVRPGSVNLDYVVFLDIVTDSSSTSTFFWPPEWFAVTLNSEIRNREGVTVANFTARGEGKATYSEYFMNEGQAGRVAMLDALVTLQNKMLMSQELTGKKDMQTKDDIKDKLGKLKAIFDEGIITKEEYELKRSKIISEF